MQDNVQILNAEVMAHIPEGWESVIKLLYRGYDSRGEFVNPQVGEYHRIIEKNAEGLPVETQNEICTAVVRLCVEYERIAFSDGVAIGAKLILELLGKSSK